VIEAVRVKISYAELQSLRPHEEVIEERARHVRASIARSGVLRRPLLVDEKTGVIIDGTHRHAALRSMGVPTAPVIYLDYLSEDEVKVSRWVRVYVFNDVGTEIIRAISEHFSSYSCEALIESTGRSYIVEIVGKRATDAYRAISQVERDKKISSSLKAILYRTKIDKRHLGRGYIAIIPPYLSKREVIDAGVSGNPFPPKSTRHLTILKRIEMRVKVRDLLRHFPDSDTPRYS